MILAVDPGLRGCGAAVFDGAALRAATYVRNPVKAGGDVVAGAAMALAVVTWARSIGLPAAFKLVVEVPRSYTHQHQVGDQNDLIALALVAGSLASYSVEPPRQFFPRDWKGTLDGDEFLTVIEGRLSITERSRISGPPSLLHNVIDAVGIGLKHLGRLNPTRVFHREP